MKVSINEQLGLSEADIKAKTYSEWSDEKIAKLVRHLAKHIESHKDNDWQGVSAVSASMVLIELCREANAAELTLDLSSCTKKSNPEINEDWQIIIKKTKDSNDTSK